MGREQAARILVPCLGQYQCGLFTILHPSETFHEVLPWERCMALAVVFDLDDTLYPEASYNLSGFRAVGVHVAERYGFADFGTRCSERFKQGARGRIFDEVMKEIGLDVPVADLVRVYRDHVPDLALYEDAQETLQFLGRRMPMGLLTDGFASVQRRKVAALGLEEAFGALVFSDDEGPSAWKPSPRPYLRMMEALGSRADGFLYVGDNPRKDFVSARKLGWLTLRVERPGSMHPWFEIRPGYGADFTVESLRQVAWGELY